MKSKIGLNSISFFLFILLLFKVSALHVYSHHQDTAGDTVENCDVCDSAIENQNAEFVFLKIPINDSTVPYSFDLKPPTLYSLPSITSKQHFRLFGRPPPVIG